MNVCSLVGLLCLGFIGAEEVLDDFSYRDNAVAQSAWVTNADGLLSMTGAGADRALNMQAPFAAKPDWSRVTLDRPVSLDLSGPSCFTLEIDTETPDLFSGLTLYFRSGQGWYGCGRGFLRRGRHVIEFPKSAFRPEGSPAGWDQVDRIRIAAWQGQPKDVSFRLFHLAAPRYEVVLITPESDSREATSTKKNARQIADMLQAAGLGVDFVKDTAVDAKTLRGRRVVLLPNNPKLPPAAVDALAEFIEAGGKLWACYHLPPRLADLLGFGSLAWQKQIRPGQFAEIRFEADDIAGLPRSVRQHSWNVTTAEPRGHGARVLGHWYDDAGKLTGHPALLLSDRGAFFSHVLLPDDREGKQQLLAAVLGHLSPPLWREMAISALAEKGRVGHCEDRKALVEYLDAQGNAASRELLEKGQKTLAQAQARYESENYPASIRLARQGHDMLVEAYLRAAPSPKCEGRAWWNHSGTGAYPGDWDRTAREHAEAGFNMILPNMLWAGRAHYPSDILPRSETYRRHGDQIAQCVAAAHKYGLEVHAWKVNYYLSGAPKEFVEQLRQEGRLQKAVAGESRVWLCPSHPENFKLERDSMLEVARKYDVDGLHFDYIRYPGENHCFCDGCRRRFEAATGRKVENWPGDCYRGARREAYRQWRCDQITRLVEAVHREARKIRPEIQISAAVFNSYPACRNSVGQDWVA